MKADTPSRMEHTQAGVAAEFKSESIRDTISAYFATLNASQFEASAKLFAAEGQLLPPFESAIVGREAIAAYLQTEAKGMQAVPQSSQTERLDSGEIRTQVTGQVQAPLFTVNVSWQFLLNADAEIVSLKIKLLAALKDLLHLKR